MFLRRVNAFIESGFKQCSISIFKQFYHVMHFSSFQTLQIQMVRKSCVKYF